VFLLHGVTGSGKTEVYVKLIWEVLDSGKSAIVLQPEIALSTQIYRRLRDRFGNLIANIHSAISPGERHEIIRRIRADEVRVVIGPRSALFSPIDDVGLIVVDEEHDSSYKQSGTSPMYNGRDSAVMAGRIYGCPVILGSATPSAESWMNARESKYTLITLGSRWDSRKMPEVELVEYEPGYRAEEPLSERIVEAISEDIEDRAQSILFLNRRGFAPVVKCLECGVSARCPNCDIGLVHHRSADDMNLCHLCGYTAPANIPCESCGEQNWGLWGIGTQRIEEFIRGRFPDARIGRIDVDSSSEITPSEMLDRFGRGKIDILIGTQMVAKGMDFGRVRTMCILNADAAMSMPDFRAVERAVALVFQAAGRAGRGAFRGRVLIQTENTESLQPHIADLTDYSRFLNSELDRRRALGFPPYSHLILLRIRSPLEEKGENAARILGELLGSAAGASGGVYRVLGPAPAPFHRIKNNFRWLILLKTNQVLSTLGRLKSVSDRWQVRVQGSRASLVVDVDPYDML